MFGFQILLFFVVVVQLASIFCHSIDDIRRKFEGLVIRELADARVATTRSPETRSHRWPTKIDDGDRRRRQSKLTTIDVDELRVRRDEMCKVNMWGVAAMLIKRQQLIFAADRWLVTERARRVNAEERRKSDFVVWHDDDAIGQSMAILSPF